MQVIKKQEVIRKKILENCKTCSGNGCKNCASKVEQVLRWSNAGIPLVYWNYSLDTFTGDARFKDFLAKTMSNLDEVYSSGRSLAFVGRFGVGKTFGACEILKKGTLKYNCFYTTMSEIIDNMLSKNSRSDFRNKLLESDLLVIDEFDSRYVPSSELGLETFGATLENIIRTRFQHQLPIIFCTNNDSLSRVFEGIFGDAFKSLFSKSVIEIPVGGIDLRRK